MKDKMYAVIGLGWQDNTMVFYEETVDGAMICLKAMSRPIGIYKLIKTSTIVIEDVEL